MRISFRCCRCAWLLMGLVATILTVPPLPVHAVSEPTLYVKRQQKYVRLDWDVPSNLNAHTVDLSLSAGSRQASISKAAESSYHRWKFKHIGSDLTVKAVFRDQQGVAVHNLTVVLSRYSSTNQPDSPSPDTSSVEPASLSTPGSLQQTPDGHSNWHTTAGDPPHNC